MEKSEEKLKNKKEENEHGEVYYSWEFSESRQQQRDKSWYTWAFVMVAALLIYSFIDKNFLFGVIVLVSFLTILLIHRNEGQIKFEMNEDGILVNDRFIDYQGLKNFYIIYQPPEVKTLYFETKGMGPRIPIQLLDNDPVAIREILLRYVDENLDREDEPVSDQFSRILKL